MITGIGIDIIELKRIEVMMNRQQKFSARILTETEMTEFETLSNRRKVEFLAGRFSAKEAYSKAVGTGIGQHLSFLDIEVSKDDKGKPYFSKPKSSGVHLSISHSNEYAVAQVIIEG